MVKYDLLVTDANTIEFEQTVDIGISDGEITEIGDIKDNSKVIINAEGNLVSPGLVDPHKHIDRALAVEGGQVPFGNEHPFDMDRSLSNEHDYYKNSSIKNITDKATQNIEMAVSHGSIYVRSHITVDSNVRQTDNMKAAVAARNKTSDIVNLQLVPGSREDTTVEGHDLLKEAIELGKIDDIKNSVLLGGSDPANRTGDLGDTLDVWFETASNNNIDMDFHINEPDMLGAFVLDRLMDYTEKYEYKGRVTATHSYALAQMPDWRATEIIQRAADVDLGFITCYNSVRHGMPIKEMLLQDNISFGHGTDNDRDFVIPHGNANQIEAMIVIINKLHDMAELIDADQEYRWLESNPGLQNLWTMLTYGGARILGIEDEYGIEEENPANIVLFDSPSPQWTIINQRDPTHVIKKGQIVAKDGSILPDFKAGGE